MNKFYLLGIVKDIKDDYIVLEVEDNSLSLPSFCNRMKIDTTMFEEEYKQRIKLNNFLGVGGYLVKTNSSNYEQLIATKLVA